MSSTLKNSNSLLKSVRISLGKIANSDVTYLNGKIIGETDGRNMERAYIIPFDAINWDKENVIAIRVTNRRNNGGMYAGNPSIGNTSLKEIVLMERVSLEFRGNTLTLKRHGIQNQWYRFPSI